MKKLLGSLEDIEFVKENGNCDLIGYGALSQVRKVLHKTTGKFFALKEMNLNEIHVNDIQNINREVKNHMKLNHPNVIHLFDHFTSPNKHLYLLLEYADNNNLFHFIHKHKQLDERTIHKFFFQTLQSIEYIHQRNIMHRDLKPENLLLDKNTNIKLCDFGWCAEYSDYEKRQTFCGTSEYMAPEIFGNKKQDFKIDIWSLGILLFEMYHKKAPFTGRSPKDIYNCILKRRISFSPTLCPLARDLIDKLLVIEPSQRPTIDQIYAHPYFKKFPFFKINTIDPKAISNKSFRHSYIGNENIKSTTLTTQQKPEPTTPTNPARSQPGPQNILPGGNLRPLTAQLGQTLPNASYTVHDSQSYLPPSNLQPSQALNYSHKQLNEQERHLPPKQTSSNFIKSLEFSEEPQKNRANNPYSQQNNNLIRSENQQIVLNNPYQNSHLQSYSQTVHRPPAEQPRNQEDKREPRLDLPSQTKPLNISSMYNIYSPTLNSSALNNGPPFDSHPNTQGIFTSNYKPPTYHELHQNRQMGQVTKV